MAGMDWSVIQAEFVTSTASLRDLAEKHGVSYDALRRQAAKGKWTDARKKNRVQVRTKVTQNVTKKVIVRECDRLAKLASTSDAFDEILEGLMPVLGETLEKTPGLLMGDLRGVESLAKAIKTAVGIKRDLYCLSTQAQAESQRVAAERLDMGMMDFKGKDDLMQKVQQLGTMQQMLMQFQGIALELASRYEPELAQQLSQIVMGQAGVKPTGAAQAQEGGRNGEDSRSENILNKSRERVQNATTPQ